MEVLTLQTRVYYPGGSIKHYKHEYITQMEVLTLQTRWNYKHEYITQMEVLTLQTRVYYHMQVLTLQTRVYYPDGSINITNTSILPRWKY